MWAVGIQISNVVTSFDFAGGNGVVDFISR